LLKQREATAKTSCALSRLIASHSGPFIGCQFIQERLIESGKHHATWQSNVFYRNRFSLKIQWLNARVTLSMTPEINRKNTW
jgi:hypothetical protein